MKKLQVNVKYFYSNSIKVQILSNIYQKCKKVLAYI